MKIALPDATALGINETLTFRYTRTSNPDAKSEDGFIIRRTEGWYAYRNQCRHVHISLDMLDGDFYHKESDRIVCKTHGATYLPENGMCDYGPCQGRSLEGFPVQIDDQGVVVVSIPQTPFGQDF